MNSLILVSIALLCFVVSGVSVVLAVTSTRKTRALAEHKNDDVTRILEILSQQDSESQKGRAYMEWLQDHVSRGVQLLAKGHEPTENDGRNSHRDRGNGHADGDPRSLH